MFFPEHLILCKERWGDIEVHETVLMFHPELDAVSAGELAGEACYFLLQYPLNRNNFLAML